VVTLFAVGKVAGLTVTVTGTKEEAHNGVRDVITTLPFPGFIPCVLTWFVPML
jgi:hypothetical protein